jgi:molybdate transport system permease protein
MVLNCPDGMDWSALTVSASLAMGTVLLLLPACIALARWLATTQSAWRAWVEALVLLPLLLPPTVVGFYFLGWFANTPLSFSFVGLLVASALVNIPFMVQPMERSFAAVPAALREAAWVSGLSAWRAFLRIELPLAWPGIAGAIALTLAHTLGEFGVVLMVGGNIPGQTRTLSIAIYDRVQALDFASAHFMAACLVAVSVLALAVVSLAGRRK